MRKLPIYFSLFMILSMTACSIGEYSPEHKLSLGPITVVNIPSTAHYGKYFPDGKLCTVKKDDTWQTFWAECVNIKTEASSPWPEDHVSKLLKSNEVYGKMNYGSNVVDKTTGFNENGSWFIGVFPLNDSGRYIGFYHAESHRDNEPGYEGTTGIAHKSIGVTYSDDFGKTWHDSAPIIVDSKTKSESSGWSGLGDGCVVYDEKNKRWLCYYQGPVSGSTNSICLAMSEDPEARSGTWKKWDGNRFCVEAYNSFTNRGGTNFALRNLNYRPGANPSVMWNHYLNKWVMVYHGWSPKQVYISFSKDGITWSSPARILGSSDNPIWYPNLISAEGDLTGGKDLRLYFSYQQADNGKRKLAYCTLTFE